MEKKLSKPILYGLTFSMSALLLGGIYYTSNTKTLKQNNEKEDHVYVSKLFNTPVESVVSTENIIIKPYTDTSVKEISTYYDYKAKEKQQENSIINYDTTYIQNSGIAYGGTNNTFDVVSILEGKVTSVKEDKLMGKIITIEHDTNVISTYKSLSETTVKEGDIVGQGTVIGKAGESNLDKNLGKHVLFEISVNNNYINPNNCFDKTLTQIKSA